MRLDPATIRIRRGRPGQEYLWTELWWVDEGNTTFAARKSASDNLWYLTIGYMQDTKVLHGPFKSLEALEMLLRIGEFNDEE